MIQSGKNSIDGKAMQMNILERLKSAFTARNIGFAFTDIVVGRPVFYFTDAAGRYWMAFGKWSMFRCYTDRPALATKERE